VMVQKAVMATIRRLQTEQRFTALLISHDLGTVLEAADRLLVMYAGRIVEDVPAREALTGVHHPYTDALLGCYGDPRADVVELRGIPGTPPDLSLPDAGCPYVDRCEFVQPRCRDAVPPLNPVDDHRIACIVRAPGDTAPDDPDTDDPGHRPARHRVETEATS